MTGPNISIFIPAYNAAPFLAAAIDSVRSQTYPGWELLILDDCSSDESYEIALSYASQYPNIRAFRNHSNLGMLANWNKGISLCSAPYFVKLDADDYWHPTMLEKSLAVLDKYPEVGIVFTKYVNVDESGATIPGSETMLPEFAREKPFSCVILVNEGASKMLGYPILRQGVSIIRRFIFDEIGNYRYLLTKDTQAATDTEFYFRVGSAHQIYCIDEVLYFYRVHNTSISSLDTRNELQSKKLYETKTVINDYYFSKKLITRRKWRNNRTDIEFRYAVNRMYMNRVKKNFFACGRLFFQMIFLFPLESIQFYTGRMKNRFSENG